MPELYYQNGYLTQTKAIILATFEDDGRSCVKFDNNIYFPQGGGQKGDRGEILIAGDTFRVCNTIKDPYSSGAMCVTERLVPESYVGSEAICNLDWDFRYRQMKLHTCVHLHHCMIEAVVGSSLDNPKVSSIEDGFSFNKYPKNFIDSAILEEANKKFFDLLRENIPVLTYPDPLRDGFRWWECVGYKIPCGGVHVCNLQEIQNVDVSKSVKKGFLTVKFTLRD